MIGFPTSSDIYIEADGKKIAVVQSYKAKSTRKSRVIEAFGEAEPVCTVDGGRTYTIELTRLYTIADRLSDGVDFFSVSDFSLVIVKPDRRIVYTGCRWSQIEETGTLGDTVTEKITLTASKRVETK